MSSLVGLASDHAGFGLKQYVKSFLLENSFECEDFGTDDESSCDYPDFAHKLAFAIEKGHCNWGIAICGSGNGINITLNKHQSIRSALCWLPEIALLARQHNDANVLVLPARFISEEDSVPIIRSFMEGCFEGERHQTRIDKIKLNT
ncbi:RpiB/LacA/LacB family sugar-phosphate isomerase [Dysgonomonas sp. ZJ279]|uniref:RpiB/LacA/LacB family sugar-phosphate isomerase n=1 Tax=Dysgonomonas sp. ZJ279 TaxID=2709796 RepID=UPI0013EA4568|nr:RpiB/LacA/LacB family sugar-phosphate isomerase [Dysgonomonas sp. ZJ279]